MNFLKLFRKTISAFEVYDEPELAFLYGNNINSDPSLTKNSIKVKGLLLSVMAFVYYIFSKLSLFRKDFPSENELLVYIASRNQMLSFLPLDTYLELKTIFTVNNNCKEIDSNCNKVNFSLKVILVALLVLCIRGPVLYFRLLRAQKKSEIRFGMFRFFLSYVYIPYFYELLNSTIVLDNSIVAMSNDHNVDNRCLLLVAKQLGLRTLYIQHASVSEFFPVLEFDYAMLDGEIALSTYLGISKKNRAPYITRVYLTGQKKNVVPRAANIKLPVELVVGIAVNILDNPEAVKNIINSLVHIGFNNFLVRYHPNQDKVMINSISELANKKESLKVSDPQKMKIEDFFNSISLLIAQESSIHLEGALCGIPTFHSIFGESSIKLDYYGYVKNGLSYKLDATDLRASINSGLKYCQSNSRQLAIKRYSETYGSKWYGNEGYLSAKIINAIYHNQSISSYLIAHEKFRKYKVYKVAGP